MKIVVITSIVVRFTLKAASKKKGLKKVVAKVIAVRRRVGKKVVIISLMIFLFMTIDILIPGFPFSKDALPKFQPMLRKIGMSGLWLIFNRPGTRVTVVESKLPIAMSIAQV